MEQLLSALPQLVKVIQEAGVVGVMVIAGIGMGYEIARGRKQLHAKNNELAAVYGQRDTLALCVVKLKTICEANKIAVDLSDAQRLLQPPQGVSTTPIMGLSL